MEAIVPESSAVTPLKAVFRFPFQGPEWRNRFLVGTAFMFAGFVVPIVPLIFVYGYALQVMRQAIEGQDLTLPAWADFYRLGKDGLRGAAVSLVFMLPGALVSFGGMALYMAASCHALMAAAARDPQGEAIFVMLLARHGDHVPLDGNRHVAGLPARSHPVATHMLAKDKLSAAFPCAKGGLVGDWLEGHCRLGRRRRRGDAAVPGPHGRLLHGGAVLPHSIRHGADWLLSLAGERSSVRANLP
jgi:hypothetical protein